ncbi:MAG: KamA family radical SAM protein [Weeksellaceae bacterium]
MLTRDEFIFSLPQLKTYLADKNWDMNRITLPETMDEKQGFYLLIPKYYVDLIDWYNINDPLKLMVLTNHLEKDIRPYETTDPIGDAAHSPVPGIVHRYPDRCLLMLTNVCAVHCRFCFRKNLLTHNKAHLQKSLEYIQQHTELWEVIFSGGDPFMLTDAFLEKVLHDLGKINHLQMIRFHTRTPAVYPARVSETFLKALQSSGKPITVVIHINHPSEITEEFKTAIKLLKQTTTLLLSQTVLMKDVNDNPEVLAELFKSLAAIGIKPYYLHHLDIAAGTHYFRVSLERGKEIVQQLRGNISGVCMPEYVIDTPGGHGKIPVFWFKHIEKNFYEAINFEGDLIRYTDHILQ